MEVAEIELLRALVKTELEPIRQNLINIKDQQKEIVSEQRKLREEYNAVLVEQKVNKKLLKILISTGSIAGTILTLIQILFTAHVI